MQKRYVFIIFALLLSSVAYILINKTSDSTEKATDSSQTKDKETPKPQTDAALEQKLASWAATQPAQYGIEVREINGELRTAAWQADKAMVPASTYKTLVAYAALKEIENGKYTLDTKTRTGQTIQQCMEKMMISSDNECGRAIGFLLDWEHINSLLKKAGLNNTNLNNYDAQGTLLASDKASTAKDQAILLEKLGKDELLNPVHTELLLGIMRSQTWRERFAAGLPPGIQIASKPGWLEAVQADAGIVYGPKSSYVIAALSNSKTTKPLADLSKLVYEHLQL